MGEFIMGNSTKMIKGDSKSALYGIWDNMKQRCYNPKNLKYKTYGALGITVHNDWLDFNIFKKWAYDNGYSSDKVLKLINRRDNYGPDNCAWVSRRESFSMKLNSKLNFEKAKKIRERYNNGVSQKVIAHEFNCSQAFVSRVINKLSWKE